MVRKALKDHGTGQWIEGRGGLVEGDAVCVVEDTVTTAEACSRRSGRSSAKACASSSASASSIAARVPGSGSRAGLRARVARDAGRARMTLAALALACVAHQPVATREIERPDPPYAKVHRRETRELRLYGHLDTELVLRATLVTDELRRAGRRRARVPRRDDARRGGRVRRPRRSRGRRQVGGRLRVDARARRRARLRHRRGRAVARAARERYACTPSPSSGSGKPSVRSACSTRR